MTRMLTVLLLCVACTSCAPTTHEYIRCKRVMRVAKTGADSILLGSVFVSSNTRSCAYVIRTAEVGNDAPE